MANKMVFTKSSQALSLSETNRVAVLAGLNRGIDPFCAHVVKELPIRLLTPQSSLTEQADIFPQ